MSRDIGYLKLNAAFAAGPGPEAAVSPRPSGAESYRGDLSRREQQTSTLEGIGKLQADIKKWTMFVHKEEQKAQKLNDTIATTAHERLELESAVDALLQGEARVDFGLFSESKTGPLLFRLKESLREQHVLQFQRQRELDALKYNLKVQRAVEGFYGQESRRWKEVEVYMANSTAEVDAELHHLMSAGDELRERIKLLRTRRRELRKESVEQARRVKAAPPRKVLTEEQKRWVRERVRERVHERDNKQQELQTRKRITRQRQQLISEMNSTRKLASNLAAEHASLQDTHTSQTLLEHRLSVDIRNINEIVKKRKEQRAALAQQLKAEKRTLIDQLKATRVVQNRKRNGVQVLSELGTERDFLAVALEQVSDEYAAKRRVAEEQVAALMATADSGLQRTFADLNPKIKQMEMVLERERLRTLEASRKLQSLDAAAAATRAGKLKRAASPVQAGGGSGGVGGGGGGGKKKQKQKQKQTKAGGRGGAGGGAGAGNAAAARRR